MRTGCGGVYFIGVAVLGRSFAADPSGNEAYLYFWLGLALSFLSACAIALGPRARAWHPVLALAMLGAVLWLPTFLRSPAYPIFQDELYHVQSLNLMAQLGSTRIPTTIFPIAGDYPGLELVGLSTMFSTGLDAGWAVRLVPLTLHVLIPLLAFYTIRACGLAHRAAFIGALIYMANSSFYFFHSIYSYETMGIALFLMVTLLALRRIDPQRKQKLGTTFMLMLSMLGIVVTHHISSAMAGIMILLLFGAHFVARKGGKSPMGDAAVFAGVLWLTWLLYSATHSLRYLSSGVIDRATAIVAFILQEQTGQRNLFSNTRLPLGEQLVAYAYPLLIGLLAAWGVLNVLLRRKDLRSPFASIPGNARLALFVFGPLVWAATAPLIFTRSSDMVYRAWPFLFLGVAFYAAIGLGTWITRGGRLAWAKTTFAVLAAAFAVAGGVIVGDNQAGRFHATEVHAAAGPETLTEDLLNAAEWVQATSGSNNIVVGDKSSAVAFSVFGMQNSSIWQSWLPFYTNDRSKAQEFLNKNNVSYVAVDLRDSLYPARYQVYFSQAELFHPETQNSVDRNLLPLENLTKFEQMQELQRVYDNGDIVLYRNR